MHANKLLLQPEDPEADLLEFYATWQKQLYLWVEEGNNVVNKIISYGVVFLIIIATVGFVLETVPEWKRKVEDQSVNPFKVTESVCIVLFTVEIVAKIACQPMVDGSYTAGVVSWFKQAMNIVDLVAVLPWYLELILGGGAGGLAVVRAVRLVRVFRVFKLGRYNTSAQIFKTAMTRSAQPLFLLFYFMLIANILFASAIYYAENIGPDNNPSDEDNFGLPYAPFDSIPRAMYWCMVTMTTVGYGDMFPITLIGRIVAVLTMLAGIVVIALPITLIGSNFVEEYRKSQAAEAKEKKRIEANERAVAEMRIGATLKALMTTDAKGLSAVGGKDSALSSDLIRKGGSNVLRETSQRLMALQMQDNDLTGGNGTPGGGGRSSSISSPSGSGSPAGTPKGGGVGGMKGVNRRVSRLGLMVSSPSGIGSWPGSSSSRMRMTMEKGEEEGEDDTPGSGAACPWDPASPSDNKSSRDLAIQDMAERLESMEKRMMKIEQILVQIAKGKTIGGNNGGRNSSSNRV